MDEISRDADDIQSQQPVKVDQELCSIEGWRSKKVAPYRLAGYSFGAVTAYLLGLSLVNGILLSGIFGLLFAYIIARRTAP